MERAVAETEADLIESRFCAYEAESGRSTIHATPEATSFAEAALEFVENWHAADDDDAVSVIVIERETGRQHCYTVDIGSGMTAPCE